MLLKDCLSWFKFCSLLSFIMKLLKLVTNICWENIISEIRGLAENCWIYPGSSDCTVVSLPVFLVLLWQWGWEQVSGRKKETNAETCRTKTEEGKQRKREDMQQTERIRAAHLLRLLHSSMCRCWVYKYPFFLWGNSAQQDALCPPAQTLPSPPCPARFYPHPRSPPLLYRLIRILGLVRAGSPRGPLIQKLIPSDVTSQCQGDRC